MPWTEADREKYAVIRERYASDLSDEEFALTAPACGLAARPQAHRSPDHSERVVLFDSCGLSVAVSAEGLSCVHDRAKPILRLAQQRFMDANSLPSGDGGPPSRRA